MKHFSKSLPVFCACGLLACGDPLREAQRVEELRVLGARLTTEDAPLRATPRAGETATVEWLLADPTALPPFTKWSLSVCVAEDKSYGVPSCRDEPLAVTEQLDLSDEPPVLSFVVPDEDTLAGATRLAAFGVFCEEGELDPPSDIEDAACAGAGVTQRASFDIFIASNGFENDNPDLADADLGFSGTSWSASAGPADCEAGELPSVSAGSGDHAIVLTLRPSARQSQPRRLGSVDFEALQISHFATLGALDRRFSNIAPEDDDPTVSISWRAPAQASEATLASFYFVVRDGRGGTSWLTRSLCVEP